jgi:hypothetical protein
VQAVLVLERVSELVREDALLPADRRRNPATHIDLTGARVKQPSRVLGPSEEHLKTRGSNRHRAEQLEQFETLDQGTAAADVGPVKAEAARPNSLSGSPRATILRICASLTT